MRWGRGEIGTGVFVSMFAVVWFGLVFLIWSGFLTRGWQILVAFERLKLDGNARTIRGRLMRYADFDEVNYVYMRPMYSQGKHVKGYVLGIRLRGVNKIFLGEYMNEGAVENAGIQIANHLSVAFEKLT